MRLARPLGTAALLALSACHEATVKPASELRDGARAELLLVGVFHFDDKGLDAYKPRFKVDVLATDRQRQLDRLSEQLAAFHPTKVAVEATADEQSRLDSLFRAYAAGASLPGPNEVYQLGFRLAKRLGLARVDAVDVQARPTLTDAAGKATLDSLGVSMDTLLNRIKSDPWTARYQELYARDDSLKTVHSLAEHLLYLNSAERLRQGQGAYLIGSFKLGKEFGYIGPDDATAWFNRNLRIFSNLQGLTSGTAERILLIIGAGHVPILRFLVASSPEHSLRELSEFVTP
ncbi:MAG TPA: DUF5694 domain-containing protein [Gemmatimonadales bacterium]|nr:DUF5694 domain-containing protein [Gemmatimonadales bacterium]